MKEVLSLDCHELAALPVVANRLFPYFLVERKVQLQGDLGAGKTTFVKAIAELLDVQEPVTSPTFSLLNHYQGRWEGKPISIVHADLYRIDHDEEIWDIGFEDYLHDDSLLFVEWAERIADTFAPTAYTLKIEQIDDQQRRFTLFQNS